MNKKPKYKDFCKRVMEFAESCSVGFYEVFDYDEIIEIARDCEIIDENHNLKPEILNESKDSGLQ